MGCGFGSKTLEDVRFVNRNGKKILLKIPRKINCVGHRILIKTIRTRKVKCLRRTELVAAF